jgi:hypothetical protein
VNFSKLMEAAESGKRQWLLAGGSVAVLLSAYVLYRGWTTAKVAIALTKRQIDEVGKPRFVQI